MKLTKKLEAEIRKVYEAFWDSYINGDLKTYASLLDADFKFIGSTEAEPLLNKKDSIKFLEATAEQLRGKAEFRNRNIKVETADDLILITELCDGYILIGSEWNFYSRFRLSSLLKKRKGDWMFIHQHVSMPDSKAQEGESYGLEQIRTENVQLRDAVKRRTVELQNKNRELEIETALERVRAVAMAMRKPEDLPGIGETLFTQLKSLGFTELRNTEIIIISDEKETLTSYYYSDYGVTGLVEVDYKSNPKVQSWVDQLKKANDAFAEVVITKKEIKAWRKYREEVGHLPDPKLNEAKEVHYYSYSIGMGGLSISTFKPASKEQIKILERFRNVFNLSYQRYIDIAKAEAQAREAQIEAALERVRSRSMAMHKSDDLHEVIKVVTEQLSGLSLKFNVANFAKIDPDGSWDLWLSTPEQTYPALIHVPYLDHPIFNRITEVLTKGNDFSTDVYSREEANIFFHHFFENTIAKNTPEERKQFVYSSKGFARSLFLTKNIWFSVGRYDASPFTNEENAIFKRFANVFEQAYTRFLDLQKAEAQAREAKIEAALERTRTQSMLMQHSDEIMNVSNVFHEQLLLLGIPTEFSYVWLPDETKQEHQFWATWAEEEGGGTTVYKNKAITYPLDKTEPYTAACFAAWQSNEPIFIDHIPSADVKNYFSTWEELLRDAKKMRPEFFTEGLYYAEAYMKYGCFGFNIRRLLSGDEQEILRRFTVEFERTYTRFLDLQKAEAQARESQIQLSLERVRARTMAMHHSDELTEVVKLLYQEFDKLKISNESTDIEIGLIDEETGIASIWAHFYLSDGTISTFKFPLAHFDEVMGEYKQWKNTPVEKRNELFFTTEFSGKSWEKFMKLGDELPELAEIFRPLIEAKITKWVTHNAYFSHGLLTLQGTEAYSLETQEIQKRFAKVFEQTYIRFLDLQKAEAQARESQIQLALERVRARTMAMQHSEELKDAAALLFQQVKSLGVPAYSCGYNIWEKDQKTFTSWMSTQDGSDFNAVQNIPLTEDANFIRFAESRKKGEQFFVLELRGERMQEHYEYLKTIPAFKAYFDYAVSVGFDLPETQIHHLANFSHGNLLFITLEPCPEFHDVFKRFASVFEQTYTRFLDLQKAEAQAREAKIESALERVRSKTMAMQKSEELDSVIKTVYSELKQLDVSFERCFIMIFDEQKGATWWMGSPDDNLFSQGFYVQYHTHPPHLAYLKGWEERQQTWEYLLGGQTKKDWDEFIFSKTELSQLPPPVIQHMSSFEHAYLAASFESFGCMTTGGQERLSEESFSILSRFAKVFDQTYTRFNDLKQAEALAREAQIEVALERVRARTMAMQKSDELAEVATVLFQQVKALGISQWVCGFNIWEIGDKEFTWYPGSPDGEILAPCKVPLREHPVFISFDESRLRGDELFVYEKEGEFQADHYRYMMSVPGMRELLQNMLDAGLSFPTFQIDHIANFSHGNLLFITYEHFPEMHDIFKRFAKVFEQTYTRFLDLQKSEAQARESQIQLALERVRARTMAMQKSDELMETAVVLFDQLKQLGEHIERTIIGVVNEEERVVDFWATRPDGSQMEKMQKFPIDEPIVMQKVYDAWRQQKRSIVIDLRGEELESYFQVLKSRGPRLKRESFGERRVENFAFFSKGMLGVISANPNAPANVELYERFAVVFDQTYTRFLDLQKSEAQAREAKIESSLERVRSRTMGMQKSEELKEVIQVVYEQFVHLNIHVEHAGFIMDYKERDDMHIWLADRHEVPFQVTIPYFDCAHWNSFNEAKEKGRNFFANQLSFEEKNRFYQDLFKLIPGVPEETLEYYFTCPGLAISTVLLENVGLYIENFSGIPYSDEENATLMRFGKVFQQTYTRFLDLQKAEAQAREANIEASLERVRSRAMGMQTSEELNVLIGTVFSELTKLDLALTRCVIWIIDKETNAAHWWMANSEDANNPGGFYIKYHEHHPYLTLLNEWKKQNVKYVYDLHGQIKKEWDDFLFSETELVHLPQFVQDGMRAPDRILLSASFNNFGGINAASLEPLSDEHFDILLRFAKVFDLTYTRFNDLKQAEAQAKEAGIQLALERVRARTMAMQKSDELREAVLVIYEQLQHLGFNSNACNIVIIDKESGDMQYWVSGFTQETFPESYQVPYLSHPYHEEFLAASKQNKKYEVLEYSGEMKKSFDEIFFTQTDFRKIPEKAKIFMKSLQSLKLSTAFFTYGALQVLGPIELSEEQAKILERFAKVFDLTYTRFLDLQKAEAQANDARIEIALERIRARALAMHKSDELMEVAKVMREQMALLGQPELEASVVHLYEQDPDHILSWRAFRATDSHSQKIAYGHMAIPKNSCEAVREWLTKFYGDLKEYTIEMSGAKQEEWYDVMSRLAPDVVNSMRKEKSLHEKRYYRFSKFSGGALLMVSKQEPSVEAAYLQGRAAVVFDLAYRRFSDLQKAEAQAQEAQIEAALEKVRSRSLAMHKSDELQEVVNTVFERLKELNVEMDSANIAIFKEGTRDYDYWIASPVQKRSASFHMPYIDLSLTRDLIAARESGKDFSTTAYSFEEKNEWFDYAFKKTDFKLLNEERKQFILNAPAITVAIAFSKHTGVQINRYANSLPSEEEAEILKRFSKVFEQAYIRFLDLEKAEAQARDAQIEASLERVRSKTMAMHNSQDVGDTVATMFDELVKLGIETMRCGVGIHHEGYKMELWTAKPDATGKIEFSIGDLDMKSHPLLTGGYESWKHKQENFVYELKDEDLIAYFNAINNSPGYTAKYDIASLPSKIFHYEFHFNEGTLFAFSLNQFSAESNQIFKRFAGLFGQTYRRYLDLQKAEAQAREAQIEAGLERVRARTMAMHNSEDVSVATATMFIELEKLGIENFRGGILNIKEDKTMDVWSVNKSADSNPNDPVGRGSTIRAAGQWDMTLHPWWRELYNRWVSKEEFIYYFLTGEDKADYIKLLDARRDYLAGGIQALPDCHIQGYYFGEGAVWTFSLHPHSEEDKQVMKRFASVFSLTFRRYQDLKQAEAQAREAQIEAGLERVRARTMAMHSSEDVSIATATMFSELEKLNIQNFRGGILNIRSDQTMEVWSINISDDGSIIRAIGDFDMKMHPLWQQLFETWVNKKEFLRYEMRGKEKEDYVRIMDARRDYLPNGLPHLPDCIVQSYFFGEGAVWTYSLQPHSEEDRQIMKRFTSVFSLTFRRYMDLMKAEAQAREATIEAALERVRGKAMAMHSSKDLATTIGVFYHELEGLNLTPRRCGVGLINKETWTAEISTMNATADGQSVELVGVLDMRRHPVLTSVYNNWLTKTEYHPVLRGNEIKEYYQLVRPQIDFPDYPNDTVQYGYFFFFEEGGVYAWTEKELNEDELKIYRRFTSVLSLTYKRYKDLKDAEARAQIAIKDAALDRIRADIASMRTINDLDRITPLIWNELTVLGIPFIRCGVFIMDEDQQLIHTFLSTPDGKAIAAFHLPYDTPGNLSHVIANWRQNKKYIDRWDETEFIQFADILVKQGTLTSAEQYLKTIPKGGFYLHFLPFLQGMLYVGNTTQLSNDEIELIQHVADAFSTAYARYEDFNKLEAAKQQVENTLTDLKQAQQQLVQSEKMASLGELTAGIAHEIQNPLNFVNNFSDVSNELLEEMKQELATGNTQQAIEIVNDVKQNLEKILHHGKRADAIVKGMLQHSRTSSGQKEPTDINILADEYLRLSFHGLRAKDKSFNAKFETEFDNSVGKINVIPQEIGRVILNLINNAFYAVTEKKKQNTNGYDPVVTVTTKKENGKVEIKVKDNGNGIPQQIQDKIFQPFFTTKPTGQGTGLGLSLAYDIVTKGHGGELKVETKEGEGSEFSIQIPIN